jgi:ABC-2 type transport system permease protein/oleandomycin transport system permease protein
LRWVAVDTSTITWRNLIGYIRIPGAIFFYCVQPLLYVMLFRYVFGGALTLALPKGITYTNFLLPGIFVQTVTFGAVSTAIGLAEDLQKGLVERFRALPMARSAVLGGRIVADTCRNIVVAGIITAVGYIVGFRIHTTVGAFLAGVLLILLFAYALSWGFACIGLLAPNSESAQVMAFPVIFPLTFASSAFVPVSFMPGWLQAFAQHQPISQLVDAARALMEGGPTASAVEQTLAWSIGMLVVLCPLAVHLYRRTD